MLNHSTLPAINCIIDLKRSNMHFIDLQGKKFGRLTVISRSLNNKQNKITWNCICECGKKKICARNELISGDTKSCGCYKIDKLKKCIIENFKVRTRSGFPRIVLSEEEKLNLSIKKFWERVEKSDGCWVWKGAKIGKYGSFTYRKIKLAHRFSYLIKHNNLDEKKLICHHCDNPLCVNPDHLYSGTYKTNSDDKWNRGRASAPPIPKRKK